MTGAPVFPIVAFRDLDARQQEAFLIAKLGGVLANHGFTCSRLTTDWEGADLLAHRITGEVLRVQVKSRCTIAKKYVGKDLWIAYPAAWPGEWVLVEHDVLLEAIKTHAPRWLKTRSWTRQGLYNSAHPSAALLDALDRYRVAEDDIRFRCTGIGPDPAQRRRA